MYDGTGFLFFCLKYDARCKPGEYRDIENHAEKDGEVKAQVCGYIRYEFSDEEQKLLDSYLGK